MSESVSVAVYDLQLYSVAILKLSNQSHLYNYVRIETHSEIYAWEVGKAIWVIKKLNQTRLVDSAKKEW